VAPGACHFAVARPPRLRRERHPARFLFSDSGTLPELAGGTPAPRPTGRHHRCRDRILNISLALKFIRMY